MGNPKQLNIVLDRDLIRGLSILVRHRKLKGKSDAVRLAVKEAVARIVGENIGTGLRDSLGAGLRVGKLDGENRFASEDDLWG